MSIQPSPQPQANGMAQTSASSGMKAKEYTATCAEIPRSPSVIGFGPASGLLAGAATAAGADWGGVIEALSVVTGGIYARVQAGSRQRRYLLLISSPTRSKANLSP